MEAAKLDPNVTATPEAIATRATWDKRLTARSEQQSSKNNNVNGAHVNNNAVITAQKLISGSNVYRMSSYPRGFCLIINNVDFESNKYPKRVGSDEEAQRLADVFSQLYFEVCTQINAKL